MITAEAFLCRLFVLNLSWLSIPAFTVCVSLILDTFILRFALNSPYPCELHKHHTFSPFPVFAFFFLRLSRLYNIYIQDRFGYFYIEYTFYHINSAGINLLHIISFKRFHQVWLLFFCFRISLFFCLSLKVRWCTVITFFLLLLFHPVHVFSCFRIISL